MFPVFGAEAGPCMGGLMIRSESDAKFTHCPLLKTSDDKLRFCLGSGCMMWRKAATPGGAAASNDGYCGLAGRPEGQRSD